jgi:hypothetical protein
MVKGNFTENAPLGVEQMANVKISFPVTRLAQSTIRIPCLDEIIAHDWRQIQNALVSKKNFSSFRFHS